MLTLDSELKLKKYVAELGQLVERAANDGIVLDIFPNTSTGDALNELNYLRKVLTPELGNDIHRRMVSSFEDIVASTAIEHFGHGAKKVRGYYASLEHNNTEYGYIHTPDITHSLPEPVDYSRYYKNDPGHPVNWVNPAVTVNAANSNGFKITKACCEQIDKFCNTDEWKGHLHSVITTAIADLIEQKKLKYIGA